MRKESESVRKAGLAGIPIKGWVGLAFTIAFMAVMLLSVPALRWFFVLSFPPALAIAGILHLVNRRQEARNLRVRRDSSHDLDEQPGIRIHKIPVKGWAGLVFAIGVMLLFFIALPHVRWFILLTLPSGLILGVVLYLLHRRRE
jgi:hypothetical protein